jgi:CubicO group peptidase (beta-lactamase class C family)
MRFQDLGFRWSLAALILVTLLLVACSQETETVAATVAVTATQEATNEVQAPEKASATPQPTLSPTPAPTDSPTLTVHLPSRAAPGTVTPAPSETPDGERLTFDDLMNGSDPTSPIDDSAFVMPAGAALPDHVFEGRLELFGEATQGGMEVIQGDSELDPETSHLPEFDYEFVQSGNHLIPTRRGLIITEHPVWNYIIEPGRVWKQEGDQGYSRASFPFALIWKGSNATFNGVMTFLFDDTGVSQVWYQITQETCWSLKLDFWGLLEATYHPSPVDGADRIRAAYAQELADKFPTKPIEQLAVDYPGTDVSKFGQGVTPEHMTFYGLVVGGVNYVSACTTRYGEYAYCDSMRAPSYSTAKSVFASLALMRLAQKYDPQVPGFLIKDYVPEYADSPGDWSAVTFDHTLDMATGNYISTRSMDDEFSDRSNAFWDNDFYAEKIAAAFDWPNSAPPGTQWVYRTFDTFIVVRALHNYLQSLQGPGADIFDWVVDEVFVPIEIGPGAHTTLRTKDDNWQGQPYGGYGLWWTADDVAKFSTFLNNDGGAVDGQQLLPPDLLADALQQDPDDRGVEIGQDWMYNNAFWAARLDHRRGYDCEFWVPNMQGYSGIMVVLMPNGTTYYYFSDNREFTFFDAVKESNQIIPFCP